MYNNQNNKKGVDIMKKSLSFFVLIAIAGCGITAPINVVNNFYKDIKQKNITAIMTLVHKDSDYATLEDNDWRLILNDTHIKEYHFSKVNITGKTAVVKGYIRLEDGTEINQEITLLQDNGKWLIYKIRKVD